MNKVIQTLWKLFLVTFPFSLHFLVYEEASYRFGNFSPWVSGIIYLPEIFLIFIFILSLFSLRAEQSGVEKSRLIPIILLILFLLNAGLITYWQGNLWLFGFYFFHLFSGFSFYYLIRREIIPLKQTINWLLYGALFQVILAFAQVMLNHSVGLKFIGEPHLSPDILNVAKDDLGDGTKVIRGYGTFLHANVLGAYLLTVLAVSWPYFKRFGLIFWPIILLGGIYLTGSQAAILVTGALVLVYLIFLLFKNASFKKWLGFGMLTVFLALNAWLFFNSEKINIGDHTWQERFDQNQIAEQMILEKPLGVGVSNFTLNMEEYSDTKLKPWNFQPVHNIYFLVLTEMGIQGLVLLLGLIAVLLYQLFKTEETGENVNYLPLFCLIFLASFDHLLWTSYIGPLILALAISFQRFKSV